MDDEGIRKLVIRLSRPHRWGGHVIERAAIMAEGADFDAVVAWILAHGGEPEAKAAPKGGGGGLHGLRVAESAESVAKPLRYVLPPGALTEPPGVTADAPSA